MGESKSISLGNHVVLNEETLNNDFPYEKILYLDTGSITAGKIEELQEMMLIEAPSRARRLVREDDIIFSSVRPNQRHFGIITNPKPNLVVSTGFIVISCKKSIIYPKYLYYYLSSNETVNYLHMIAEASTSTYPSIKQSDIENLTIDLPPLPEQRAIAGVLSSLDDKIDLLHRENETLEALAETLFRQWFIEEAEDDWEEGVLGDLIKLEYGKGLKKSIRSGTGFPVVGSSGIIDFHSDYLVEGPGIVIGRKGTLGEVTYLSDNFHPIDTTFYIKTKMYSPNLYFEKFLVSSMNFQNMNTDSAVPGLNRNLAESIEIILPPQSAITRFNETVDPFFQKQIANKNQINILENLRDTLLPKLMSGEVRVRG